MLQIRYGTPLKAPLVQLIVTHIFGWTQGVSEYEVR